MLKTIGHVLLAMVGVHTCSNLSRVFTSRNPVTKEKRLYQVCLDCGSEYPSKIKF